MHTSPAMRAATVNALVVVDYVIVPIDSSSFALLGMTQLLKTVAAISEIRNPNLKIRVPTSMFNKRQNPDKVIRQQAEEFFGKSLVLESIIHRHEERGSRKHCCYLRHVRLHETLQRAQGGNGS
jgi:chromosome partitioning protein